MTTVKADEKAVKQKTEAQKPAVNKVSVTELQEMVETGKIDPKKVKSISREYIESRFVYTAVTVTGEKITF